MRGPIESVVVVGYGLMGTGIVRSFARAGFRVAVVSRRAEALDDLPEGVAASPGMPAGVPDLLVETVVEDPAVKRAVYRAAEATYPPETVIASNTSGLPLQTLAEGLAYPERFVGVHWFHPADVFPMVEVVAGPSAPPATVDRVAEALTRTGKEPIVLYKPVVGYVINRLQHCLLNEAYHMIAAGIAPADTIDRVARRLLGPRLCVTGLVEQKDVGGLTIHARAHASIVPALFQTGAASPILEQMVARGDVGLDAGRGFYDWSGLDADTVRAETAGRLRAVLDALAALGPGPRPRCRRRDELP